jgi:hypothetical protein
MPATAQAITWSGESIDHRWQSLPAGPREICEKRGLNPSKQVEEGYVGADSNKSQVAWWVDRDTGEVTLFVAAVRLARRYRPTDPGVVVRKAELSPVPVANGGLTGPGQVAGAPVRSWYLDAVWQNLPEKARRQLLEAFAGNNFDGKQDASIWHGTLAKETYYVSMWDANTFAGCYASRTVPGTPPNPEAAAALLRDKPWEIIVFRVPLVPGANGTALGAGRPPSIER